MLCLPIGVGLAHTGRLIMVARELRESGIDVIFGAGADAIKLMRKEKLPYVEILDFSRETYDKKVKKNNFFVYNRHNFADFVKDELRAYDIIKPDLVVYDTRITAKISASIAGIPTVSITNADATAFYDYEKIEFPVQTTFGRFLPMEVVSLLNREYGQRFLKKISKRAVSAMLIAAMIKVFPALIKLGYKPSKDPFQYFMGDLTLIADISEFRPIRNLPEKVKQIGPIFWDGGNKLPSWSKNIEDKKNLIYVSASGTGDKNTFIKILEFLSTTDYTVAATTGNTLKPSEVILKSATIYKTDFLPGDFIMPRADLIIFPGGHATCYQALTYGVPQICTPFHIDQEDNANQLERLGTGIIVNPYNKFNENKLLNAVERVLADRSFKANSLKMRSILCEFNGKKNAAVHIKNFLNTKI